MMRILGIAPYEGLKELMEAVAALREDVYLTARVGDYRDGLNAARAEEPGSYDVILSRGGTAELLRQELETPVISIELSVMDLLKALQLAEGSGRDFAVVGFPSTAKKAEKLCTLLRLPVPVEEVTGPEESEAAVRRLREQGIGLVLGDTMITGYARGAGLQAMLLSSGSESVSEAFDRAADLVAYYGRAREEARFCRGTLALAGESCVVLEASGALRFSTLSTDVTRAVLPMLRRFHRGALKGGVLRRTGTAEGTLYRITGERLAGDRVCCLLKPLAAREEQGALRFLSRMDPEAERLLRIFYDADAAFHERLDMAARASFSLIVGEEGCGKDALASYCHFRGAGDKREAPLLILDCEALSERELLGVLQSEDSPLLERGQCVYVRRADLASGAAFAQLVKTMEQLLPLCRWIVSLRANAQERERQLTRVKAPVLLRQAPLRTRIHEIPGFVSMFLSELARESGVEIAGVEPEAMSALQSFPWPGNCRQLLRVLAALYPLSSGPYVTLRAVRTVLEGQNAVRDHGVAGGETLAIDRPLADTIAEIAQRVFEQEGRNMTRSAEKLGISRTTLWRYLKR